MKRKNMVNYSHGDDGWTALLTEYNGQAIRHLLL